MLDFASSSFGVCTFVAVDIYVFQVTFLFDHVMWLTTVYRFIIYTLIMLTTAHVDRGRPTLKDDERFRHGLIHNLQEKLFITVLLCTAPTPLEIRSPSKRLSRRLVIIFIQRKKQ